MDKAVILGIYGFLSFHACKVLLNRGFEVVGVHLDEMDHSLFIEEKRLEIGRNANFTELTLSEWEHRMDDETSDATFIFSIYDFYRMNKDCVLQNEKFISSVNKYMETNHTDIVLLLPIQMLNHPVGLFPDQVKSWGRSSRFFYLPCIYGPWQSSDFMFQQTILSKFIEVDIIKNQREWTGDALFVDDAINTVLELLETEEPLHHFRSYILESGRKNYWTECAAYLQVDLDKADTKDSIPFEIDSQIVKVPVKKLTPVADSIKKQLELVQRLYNHP